MSVQQSPLSIWCYTSRYGGFDVQGNELPSLVYVSREKRPGFQHHKKAGAMNSLVRVSGVLTNAPFMLNLDCDHYINNSKAVREAMCFLMDPRIGRKISGSALVEHKDARKILYKLWIENYLHMESVRRPPQGEFFEWSVNQNLNELVFDELFHVALNLRVRMAYEMDQRREVMRVQDKQKGDVSKKFKKLKAVKMLLDSCLAQIDDAIMLFHDF